MRARRLAFFCLCAGIALGCSQEGHRSAGQAQIGAEELGGVAISLDKQVEQEMAFFDAAKEGGEVGLGEVLNSSAGKVLSSIDKAIAAGEGIGDYVSDGATLTELRPSSLSAKWERDGLTVLAGEAKPLEARGPSALAQQWRAMRQRLGERVDMVKFKIIRSEAVGTKGFSTALYLGAGSSGADGTQQDGGPAGSVQQNAKWAMEWDLSQGADKPILTSLKVEEFEEVTRARQFLREATESVFSGVESFEQIRYGHERWWGGLDFSMGANLSGHHGFAFGDINNDGLDDLYVCEPGGLPNRLYLHQPDGRLKDISEGSGAELLNDTSSALILDLDNDGNRDLVVGTASHVVFLKGDGKGRFEPRGRYRVIMLTSMAAADYDRDGLVDLYLCEYTSSGQANSTSSSIYDSDQGLPNTLLKNEGNFQFRNVTDEVGLGANNNRQTFAAAWEDYDNDGDQDLYVANDFGPNQLYRNDGGKFVEVAAQAGVQDQAAGMGVSWGDYDRDGWMDLYVTNMWSSAGNRVTYNRFFKPKAANTRNLQYFARGNSLFENQGDGRFKDVTQEARAEMGRFAWGAHFGDLNGDGWLDIISPNGFITNTDADDL
ncbi:MAG: VCBS repeat-containing protein [Armatimonadetes bacterium]|nr:MAG: VCBS repeat-containing protein [Armatimonadota bacterium]